MPSQSRPSSHGSSGRGGIDPNHSGGSGGLPLHAEIEMPHDSKKKRHRALFTATQQDHLKKLWKQVSHRDIPDFTMKMFAKAPVEQIPSSCRTRGAG